MSSNRNVLITGANRGLGLELLKVYLAKPNTTVIAATRDPSSASSQALSELTRPTSSSLIQIRIDSASATDATSAAAILSSEHGIKSLDLVIANAGIAESFNKVADVPIEELQRHMDINVYGAVRLYQAMLPLLLNAEAPIWVSMSSISASLTDIVSRHNVQYGMSKAALNYVTAKMHVENDRLTAFALHPGWIQTDMGNRTAKSAGLNEAPMAVDESIPKVQKVIDAATRETYGGKFIWHDGLAHPW